MTEEYLEYKESEPQVGTYDPETGKWVIGELAKNAIIELKITATTLQTGQTYSTGTVTSNEPELDPSTNQAIADVNINDNTEGTRCTDSVSEWVWVEYINNQTIRFEEESKRLNVRLINASRDFSRATYIQMGTLGGGHMNFGFWNQSWSAGPGTGGETWDVYSGITPAQCPNNCLFWYKCPNTVISRDNIAKLDINSEPIFGTDIEKLNLTLTSVAELVPIEDANKMIEENGKTLPAIILNYDGSIEPAPEYDIIQNITIIDTPEGEMTLAYGGIDCNIEEDCYIAPPDDGGGAGA